MRCNFSKKHFIDILDAAISAGYRFIAFDEFRKRKSSDMKIVLLRHDVDFSPEAALVLAEIEKKRDITATYFFMLRSLFYNSMEKTTNKIIKKIIGMGHNVGLHYDEHFYGAGIVKLRDIKEESSIFNYISGTRMNCISFHDPTKNTIGKQFSGIINTYEDKFFKNIRYISDSNQNWRGECACKVLKSNKFKKIHLLLHPFIWGDKNNYPITRRLKLNIAWKKDTMMNHLFKFNDVLNKLHK